MKDHAIIELSPVQLDKDMREMQEMMEEFTRQWLASLCIPRHVLADDSAEPQRTEVAE
jgi:hypothetical protein